MYGQAQLDWLQHHTQHLCPGQQLNGQTYTGWWFQPIPLKHMSSSVGIIIPNWTGKNAPKHQPVYQLGLLFPLISHLVIMFIPSI